jgi:iron complex transport system substrate-binding protein
MDVEIQTHTRRPHAIPQTVLATLACGILVTVEVLVQAPPQRIVSLVPSATEMLFEMGAGSRVVGVSSYDTFPPAVTVLPRVGALVDPDVERILSLKPDLIITYASQTDLHTQLSRAGVRSFVYRHGSLADIFSTLRQLGAAIGLATEARTTALRLERELGLVRTHVAGRPRPGVMLVIGRESQTLRTLNVSGGYGFLHDLIETAGGRNVFADVKRESLNISTETVLARSPDVILDLRYSDPPSPDQLVRERDTWDVLRGVPAVRARRVYVLYGGELVIPGPRVVLTARSFARALHPDVLPWEAYAANSTGTWCGMIPF